MSYFLLQSGAMFLAAFFIGCWSGCFLKTVGQATEAEATAGSVKPRIAQPEVPSPRPATPAVQPPLPRPVPAPNPVAAVPQQRPPAPVLPPPGSQIAPELTAAAAAAAAAMVLRPATSVSGRDDLKRIKGIGPELEGKLNDAGVRRYSEIADWSPTDVARMNGLIGHDGRVQHENWIEQAQILAKGSETAFSRRMDRREVADGRAETWTPTAPNEVTRQAAAASQTAVRPPVEPTPSRPVAAAAVPMPSQPLVAGAAAAAAAAVAAATTAAVRQAPVAPPAAAPAAAQAPLAPPSAPPVAVSMQPSFAPVPPVSSDANRAGAGISMRPLPGQGNQRRFVRLAAPEGKSDELSLISGVGDKVAGELNRYGIYHFWQLSAMGPDDIEYLESRLALRGRMRREEWQEQARELMAGKPPRGALDRARAAQTSAAPVEARPTPAARPAAPPPSAAAMPPSAPPVPATTATQGGHARTHVPQVPLPAPVQTPSSPAPRPVASVVSAAVPVPAPAAPSAPAVVAAVAAAAATVVAAATQGAKPVAMPDVTPVQPARVVQAPPVQVAPVPPPPVKPVPVVSSQPQSAPVSANQTLPETARLNPAPAAVAPPIATAADPAQDPAANSSWTPRSRASNTAARGTRDDLKRIKGVGVVIDKKLEGLGITTYAQIAAWTTADIDKVSNALDFKGRIEREQWVQQARILGGGGQTDFSRRMDRTDGVG